LNIASLTHKNRRWDILQRTTAESLHSSFPYGGIVTVLQKKAWLYATQRGFFATHPSPMNMKVRLKNINHILSFHIHSQRNCNQFNVLLMLGLDVAMQTHLTLGVEAM
jgi:hypothetical protein